MELGNRVREARKKLGLTIKQLADRVGVSYLTIYRVETDKVSPSVALLSTIAEHLGRSISDFFDEEGKFTIVRAGEASIIESAKLRLRLLAPRGLISEGISVSLGESQRGEIVSKHKHSGFELTYIIKGNHLFRYGSKEYGINAGDLIYFDGNIPHSVTALEPIQFLSVYFRERT